MKFRFNIRVVTFYFSIFWLNYGILHAQFQFDNNSPAANPLVVESGQPGYSFPTGQMPNIIEQAPLVQNQNTPLQDTGHSFQFGPVRVESQMTGHEAETPLTITPQPAPQVVDEDYYGMVFKNSYQEVSWLFGNGDSLGITTLKAAQTISFSKLQLLSLTPEFNVHFFNGPEKTDLPGQVFSTGLKISWFQPLSQEWQLLANVTPGYYTDFDSTQDALRVSGLGLAIYKWSEELTWTFGVVYLARSDVRILPAIGLTYKPDADHKLELTFPRPRYSWRTGQDESGESWGYIGSEFGGGSWSVRRADGRDDVLTLRDYRLLIGWEKREDRSSVDFFEVGYVFSRQVEFDSEIGDFAPDSGFIVKAGWTF